MLRKGILGGSTALAVYALQFGVGVLVQLALARMLEPEAFGGFALAVLALNLVTAVGNIHADRFAIAQSSDFEGDMGVGIASELLWTGVLVAICISVAPVLPALGLREDLVVPTQILLLGALAGPFSRVRAVMERDFSFVKARLPSLVAQVVGGGIGLVAALQWKGVAPLIAWKVSVLGIEAVILWWLASGDIRLQWDWPTSRSILKFGAPLMGAAVLTYAYSNADYYVVAAFLSQEDLGAYFFAFQATALTLALRTALNAILLPIWAGGDRSKSTAVVESYPVMACAITVVYMVPTTALFGFSEQIVHAVLGPTWGQLGVLLPPLMLLASLRAAAAIWDPIVMLGDMTSVLFRVTIVRVFLAPIAIIAGVVAMGVLGAAIGALLAYAVTLPLISGGIAGRYALPYRRVLCLWGMYALGIGSTLGARLLEAHPSIVLGLVIFVNSAGALMVKRWFGDTLTRALAR